MKKRLTLLALTLIACLSMQSCKEMGINPWDKDKGGTTDTTSKTLTLDKLLLTKWRLMSIEKNNKRDIVTLPKEQFLSLTFDIPGHVSGTNLCNTYGATVSGTPEGLIRFTEIISTEALCGNGFVDAEYLLALNNATTYVATDKELRINYQSEVPVANGGTCTLVYAPLTGNDGSGGELDIRVKQLAGQTFMLYSFVNAGVEEVMTNSQNCLIAFAPSATGKGSAAIHADCNKGTADLSFSADYQSMKLDNIGLTKMACQNHLTADRFVDFLRNTGSFEYSDYGTTLTIWTSLTTFAESKMVLKLYPGPDPFPQELIDILETPASGVPVGSYPSFTLTDAVFDGQNIKINYQYNGKTADYRLSAYSLFELGKSNPPVVFVDLVSDGSMNPFSSITSGEAHLSLNAIRARILIASPGKTALTVQLRWNGQVLKSIPVIL